MRNTVAVMNTKGGVGKSTLVLAVAETLSAVFRKNVLIIDSDSQASVSAMLLSASNLHRLQSDGLTIVDLLVASVLNNVAVDWPRFVVGGVSDVDEARTVYLIPSDMQLTLFEREVSKESLHARLRTSIGALLNHVRGVFDVILIDCRPGLPVLHRSWLREADFHLAHQARLRVHLRPGGVPPLQGPQPGDGICREPRRHHQHEGRAIVGGGRLPALAQRECRQQAVHPDGAAYQRAAARLAPEPGGALVHGQVPGRIERCHPCRMPGALGPARCRQRQRGERIRGGGVASSGGVGGVFLSGD